ncbi:MAG: hypothetical protein A2653_00990 [Candidatus Zambryskibacteria bacterium RIFCSPHIGHO2_01_FULL_43_25]|nr:MAG: hypothetical protein A2653_00990 [Candidatus Zambryskibacteria bacterium RIFCSPHIGHO2_01_FULL_43_25]
MKKALFIDRDGVINRLVKYDSGWDSPQKPQDVKLIKDVEKIISWANLQKIPVIEISNQPGVAKGKIDQKTSDAIEKKVHQLLEEKGAFIDKVYICPHHRKATVPRLRKNCNCRKPKPGLILKASRQLGINLEKSIFLGDKASDVDAATKAGVKSLIYLHNKDESNKNKEARQAKADFKTSSTKEILQILRNFFKLK